MKTSICPVTAENEQEVLSLHVRKEQAGFIETTAECLREAQECSFWRPVVLCREQTAVGFAMYGLYEPEDRVWLDRFLIDERFQGQGLAHPFLTQLLERLREEYGARTVYLSLYAENTAAQKLYETHGFAFNGELDINGELVMEKRAASDA